MQAVLRILAGRSLLDFSLLPLTTQAPLPVPPPTPWPGANSPQLQSLLLTLDSFSFAPFLSSHSPLPCPSLTHPRLHLTANTPILPRAILSLWILSGLGLQFPALFLDLYFQSFLPLPSHLSLLDTVSNVLDQEMLSIRPPETP